MLDLILSHLRSRQPTGVSSLNLHLLSRMCFMRRAFGPLIPRSTQSFPSLTRHTSAQKAHLYANKMERVHARLRHIPILALLTMPETLHSVPHRGSPPVGGTLVLAGFSRKLPVSPHCHCRIWSEASNPFTESEPGGLLPSAQKALSRPDSQQCPKGVVGRLGTLDKR